MLKQIQINSCPNPKCQQKFENLIIVHDNSKMPPDTYYACPYCLIKLDPTTTQILKKETIFVEQKTQTKRRHPQREIPSGCQQYFGYLAIRPKDTLIPEECLSCLKILDCTIEKDHSVNQSKMQGLECVELRQ